MSRAASNNDKTKIALLLHIFGENVIDIFNSFTFANPAHKDDFDQVTTKFNGHFMPKAAKPM